MVIVNGKQMDEQPTMCCTCPFFFDGTHNGVYSKKGMCVLFDEQHTGTRNAPQRCASLFRKALKYPNGMNLVITIK